MKYSLRPCFIDFKGHFGKYTYSQSCRELDEKIDFILMSVFAKYVAS